MALASPASEGRALKSVQIRTWGSAEYIPFRNIFRWGGVARAVSPYLSLLVVSKLSQELPWCIAFRGEVVLTKAIHDSKRVSELLVQINTLLVVATIYSYLVNSRVGSGMGVSPSAGPGNLNKQEECCAVSPLWKTLTTVTQVCIPETPWMSPLTLTLALSLFCSPSPPLPSL